MTRYAGYAVFVVTMLATGWMPFATGENAVARAQSPTVSPVELVAQLRIAAAMGAYKEAFSISKALTGHGKDALPAIGEGINSGDRRVTRYLIGSLGGIGGDESTSLLVSCLNEEDLYLSAKAVSRLDNRPIRRPLTGGELAALVALVRDKSGIGAGRAAKVLGKCEAMPAAVRTTPILERFCREVDTPSHPASVHGSYLSPRVYTLNQFLLAFSYVGTGAVSIISWAQQERAADSETHRWLTLALGWAGDPEAAGELEQMVRDEADTSTRIVAIRAYSRSAGSVAVPLLVSLLDDTTVSHTTGSVGAGTPIYHIRGTARKELSRLGRADLWQNHPNWDNPPAGRATPST